MMLFRFCSRHPPLAGALLILAAVFLLSFVTPALSLGHSMEFPFYSIAAFNFGRALSSAVFTWFLAGGVRHLWAVFKASSPVACWYLAGRMENLIFVFSIRYISPAFSALVSECYPVFCMWMISGDARARRSGWLPLSPLGVMGVLLDLLSLVLGTLSQWTGAADGGISLGGFLLGCGLAASISVFLSFDSRVMGWSMDVGRRLPDGGGVRAALLGLSVWYVLATLFAAVAPLPAGWLAGEVFTAGLLLNFAVGLATGAAAILWRSGYLLSRRPELVGLMSFIPVLSGGWLSLSGLLESDPRLMFPALILICLSGLLVCWGRDLPQFLRHGRKPAAGPGGIG